MVSAAGTGRDGPGDTGTCGRVPPRSSALPEGPPAGSGAPGPAGPHMAAAGHGPRVAAGAKGPAEGAKGPAEGAVAAAGCSESRSAAGAAVPRRCPPLSRPSPTGSQPRPPGPPSRPPTAMIAEKLREALEPGRRETAELGRPVAAAARSVLLQRIEFAPARRGLAGQLEHLRGKYEHIGAEAPRRPLGTTGSLPERPQNPPGKLSG